MTIKIITRVNNVDIVSMNDEQLVAIKPICNALGIDAKVQRNKIQEHPILSLVMVLYTTTDVDGEEHEILCLPLMYVVGWIFSDDIRLAAIPGRVMELHNSLWRYINEEEKIQVQYQLERNEKEEDNHCHILRLRG